MSSREAEKIEVPSSVSALLQPLHLDAKLLESITSDKLLQRKGRWILKFLTVRYIYQHLHSSFSVGEMNNVEVELVSTSSLGLFLKDGLMLMPTVEVVSTSHRHLKAIVAWVDGQHGVKECSALMAPYFQKKCAKYIQPIPSGKQTEDSVPSKVTTALMSAQTPEKRNTAVEEKIMMVEITEEIFDALLNILRGKTLNPKIDPIFPEAAQGWYSLTSIIRADPRPFLKSSADSLLSMTTEAESKFVSDVAAELLMMDTHRRLQCRWVNDVHIRATSSQKSSAVFLSVLKDLSSFLNASPEMQFFDTIPDLNKFMKEMEKSGSKACHSGHPFLRCYSKESLCSQAGQKSFQLTAVSTGSSGSTISKKKSAASRWGEQSAFFELDLLNMLATGEYSAWVVPPIVGGEAPLSLQPALTLLAPNAIFVVPSTNDFMDGFRCPGSFYRSKVIRPSNFPQMEDVTLKLPSCSPLSPPPKVTSPFPFDNVKTQILAKSSATPLETEFSVFFSKFASQKNQTSAIRTDDVSSPKEDLKVEDALMQPYSDWKSAMTNIRNFCFANHIAILSEQSSEFDYTFCFLQLKPLDDAISEVKTVIGLPSSFPSSLLQETLCIIDTLEKLEYLGDSVIDYVIALEGVQQIIEDDENYQKQQNNAAPNSSSSKNVVDETIIGRLVMQKCCNRSLASFLPPVLKKFLFYRYGVKNEKRLGDVVEALGGMIYAFYIDDEEKEVGLQYVRQYLQTLGLL